MTTLAGVRPEQGPPLSVPLSFFVTAPLAVVGAGAFIAARGAEGAQSSWSTTSVAAVHFGTVGFLLFVMLGALYQMLPVALGVVVPSPRLGHVVHALLVVGAAALIFAQAHADVRAFGLAWPLVLSAVALFLGPATLGVLRARSSTPAALGLALALAGLAVVVVAGVRLAALRGGLGGVADFRALRAAHALLGVLVWVGTLISAVSWQVLPMFFFAHAPPRAHSRLVLACSGLSLVGLGVASFVGTPVAPWILALPVAFAVCLVQPAWALRALRARKRRRKDQTLRFWWLGLVSAPAAVPLAALSLWLDDERIALLLGLVMLWGWACAIAHGMLLRIVPFLIWFHWCAPRIGHDDPPSAKELVSDREVATSFGLHLAGLILGAVAVVSGHALAFRAFGLGLAATGIVLLVSMLRALHRARPRAGAPRAGDSRRLG